MTDWLERLKGKYEIKATGEPDGDYNTELYDAVVDGFKKLGYQAKHEEFDKYQGMYVEVSRGGKRIERLWVEDEMVYPHPGSTTDEEDIIIVFTPELHAKDVPVAPDEPLEAVVIKKKDGYHFVDMMNIKEWLTKASWIAQKKDHGVHKEKPEETGKKAKKAPVVPLKKATGL